MSLNSAGPGVGLDAGPCATAVEDVAAASFVWTAVGFVVVVVEDVLAAVVGAVAGVEVGLVTGGTVGNAAFFVGAARGAQAASVRVSTNTVLNRNLIFIFFSPSWA